MNPQESSIKQLSEDDIQKLIDKRVAKLLPDYLSSGGFTARKLTDTPTDNLQVTPRKYVNMFGSTLGRPVNSVAGQQYFDTDIGRPIFRRGDGAWIDGAGSVS